LAWLTTDVITGSVAGLDAFDLTVTFDSTGLADDLYEGSLCVTSNDPSTPLVEVPVSMEVLSSYSLYLPISFKP
jgi:hypothetical protein